MARASFTIRTERYKGDFPKVRGAETASMTTLMDDSMKANGATANVTAGEHYMLPEARSFTAVAGEPGTEATIGRVQYC